jgi:tetratricopeptide (TPR) repeat protein
VLDAFRPTRNDLARRNTEIRRIWLDIGPLLFKLGDAQAAHRALATARTLVDESAQGIRYMEYRGLGQAYAQAGDVNAVLEIVKDIPDQVPNYRGTGDDLRQVILSESVSAAAKAGHFADALRIAAAKPDAKSRAAAEASIRREEILRIARTGDFRAARKAIDGLPAASEKAQVLVGLNYGEWAFGDTVFPNATGLALMQIEMADRDGARQSARQALALVNELDGSMRDVLVAAAVRALARAGDFDAALKEVPKIGGAEVRLKAKVDIGMAQVRAGQTNAALEMAAGLAADHDRVFAIYQIGYAQAKAGDAGAARDSFQRAIALVEKTGARDMYWVIGTQAAAGDIAGALKAAEEQHGSAAMWSNIAFGQMKAGDYSGAMQTSDKHGEGTWQKATFLQRVAEEQARAGKEKVARAWIERETDPLRKAYALVGLAKGLFREGGSGAAATPEK